MKRADWLNILRQRDRMREMDTNKTTSAQARKPRATKEQMRINPPQTISIRVGGGLYQWLVDWEELCRGTDKNTKISRSHLCTLMMKSVQGKLDKAKEAGPKVRKLDSVHLERIMSLVDRAAEERAMKGAVGGKEEEAAAEGTHCLSVFNFSSCDIKSY
tara:strand:+ start:129 stop:605 length:477 start_codon:yes stop_codon:yes gene_type:complete